MFLERWTIDQVIEDTVAVARARYIGRLEESDPAALAERAVQLEATLAPAEWEPEFLSFLNRAELMEELELRNAAPSIVANRMQEEEDPRPLFEGQVFWFVTPRRLPELRSQGPIGPADTRWLFTRVPLHRPTAERKTAHRGLRRAASEAFSQSGQIVDATQASRRAVKREYESLLEAEAPQET